VLSLDLILSLNNFCLFFLRYLWSLFGVLFISLLLLENFFGIAVLHIYKVVGELNEAELFLIEFFASEVWETLAVCAGVDHESFPVDKLKLLHRVKNLWHDLNLKCSWLFAARTFWHFVAAHGVLLSCP
jgi:hypothetical protein